MRPYLKLSSVVLIINLIALLFCNTAWSEELRSIPISDSLVQLKVDQTLQTRYAKLPFFNDSVVTISQIEQPYEFVNKTLSFYLVLGLLLILGVLRMSFPSYFRNLYGSFMSPLSNKRTLREQIEQNIVANASMNTFFCLSIGLFLYVVLIQKGNFLSITNINPNFLLLGLVLAVAFIYLIKLGVLRFVGWTFKVQQATDDYLYNVFLINKIIGIMLLPFSIILAFGTGAWLNLVLIFGICLTAILVLNRYTRSWSSLGSFFQYSKFHFFMYFCASELLPLAIISKYAYHALI